MTTYPVHKRRYNSFTDTLKERFGGRVQKLSIDAGFTCPNRDGTAGTGGCTYCMNDAFNPSYCRPDKSVTQQIKEGIGFHAVRYRRAQQYLAYFQPYSNTYAPLEKLKKVYEEALAYPGIAGLVIGTRPDCIDDEKLDWFTEVAQKYFVAIEYGIESCYNRTLQKVNRGHTYEQAVEAINKTAAFGLHAGVHLIFGLPGESREEMLAEAVILSALPINSIKFHQLQILRHTPMEQEYITRPESFSLFTLEEYIDFIIDFIEHLSPKIAIDRFTSEVPPRYLVAPDWGLLRTDQILQRIEKRMDERDSRQGKRYC